MQNNLDYNENYSMQLKLIMTLYHNYGMHNV